MNNKQSGKYFDLTTSQSMIWTGQQMNPDSPMYNMALSFKLATIIQVPHFQAAFGQLVQACDTMRTIFVEVDGMPQQKILNQLPYQLSVEDFSTSPNKESLLKTWLTNRSQQQFDTTQRLFDAVLIKIEADKYVWYFNQHHLITDAWATTQQYSLLAKFYKKLVEGDTTTTIAVPLFEDYIIYEATQKLNTSNKDAITFWEQKASQLPDPPNFFGRSNPYKNSRSERVSITLSKEKSDALRALAMAPDLRTWTQHLSLFSIFSTILLAYIHRITGQQKLAIGTPAHNRSTATFKETPGMFIELFPLMATVTVEDTFSTLYDKVRNEALEFLRYAKTGVSNPALNRGFNVVLNYINASFSDFNGVPIASEWIHAAHADPGHHLRLQVYDFDASGCIKLCFDLNTSVFEESQRSSVSEQFLVVLDSFMEDRFQPVGQPALAPRAASIKGDKSNFNFEVQATVVTLFEQKVLNLPADTVAIQFDETSLTYQALDHHANQLAHFLLQNGLGNQDRVGILLTRSPEFVISVLAVLKAGAVFVPIPTNYPLGRITRILEDAHPTLILSSSVLIKKVPTTFSNVICLDKEAIFIKQQSITRPTVRVATDSLAYMIYTSGSTGVPKGVMIGHEALSHYIQWTNHTYTNNIRPIAPLFTSVGFDLTITSLFLPLVAGGTICTYQEPDEGPDLSLLEVLEDNKVNFIKLTPAHLSLIKGNNYTDSLIESMVVGGENFKTDLAIYVEENFKDGIKIYNEYGPTEATVGCVVHRYDALDKKETAVPIGLPIAHTEIYILDEHKNIVPDGVVGELYIGGIGLAKGYWKQVELTQAQFITNPFKEDTLLYRTGDLVRKQHSNNYLEYLGRKDLQVKIRGRRVELAEIEAVINQYPGLTQGIVELRQKQRVIKEAEVHNCVKCGLPSNYPTATFSEKGVCNLCQDFESYQDKVKQYFKTPADFKALVNRVPQAEKGAYDCLVLLSGGKDSTYVVAKVKEMGFRVLAFTLDNGYISEEAKDNVRRVVTELGVDHVFGQTEAMNAIFVDSLQKHCNVCDGCFKTIYTLSVQLALEKNIPFIITGLSRGQFFETRLTEELFRQEVVDVDKIDKIILNARKSYHQTDDAVKKLLDVSMFEDESVFEKIRFVDFYRYTDVSLAEMLEYLNNQLPWERPSDTGRSTNCLINQAGIYVHKKKLGYSNYAFPYSWDVRIGHKTRDASLEEINEEINETEVLRMLKEIGYTEAEQADESNEQLVAYYVAETDINEPALRNYLLTHFPDYMVPVQFIPLEKLPLTINGKIDRAALPRPDTIRPVLQMEYVAPQTEFEEIIQATWSEVLQIDQIGIHDNFLEIGGDSLSGIRVISRLNEAFELELPINLIFKKPSITQLATHIEETIKQLLNIS